MTSATVYDSIGVGYSRVRRPDPRIAATIRAALGDARRVLNVGAGTGSYEPTDRTVVAVEPSALMIRQRPGSASNLVVRGLADHLPFAASTFDGTLALLTVHHWSDPSTGLRELRRVADGPVVVFTFDHAVHSLQWLSEYFPPMSELDGDLPSPESIAELLGGGRVEVVPVPHDCLDGFCHAWWRRPGEYLKAEVRAGISGIARLPEDVVEEGRSRLAGDIESGRWHGRHGDLMQLEEIDAGYRLVVAP